MRSKLSDFSGKLLTIVTGIGVISLMSGLLSSCSIDILENYGNPFGRENFREIGLGTIGSEGGAIEADSVYVVVPEGAFDETVEITILRNKRDTTFRDYSLTPMYSLTGLPKSINLPIKVYLPYGGIIEGDTLIAVGERGYATSTDTMRFAYHTLDGNGADGLISFYYPAGEDEFPDETGQMQAVPSDLRFTLINGYGKHQSSGGHFEISYPQQYLAGALKVGNFFELAYDSCMAMNYELTAREWPVQVIIKQLDQYSLYTQYIADSANPSDDGLSALFSHGKFAVGAERLSDDQFLLYSTAHEFFHLVQNLYEFSAPWAEPNQAWLKEATAVWFENKFSASDKYVSSSIVDSEHLVFEGLQKADGTHGYGLSFLIKDLVEDYGEPVVWRIFNSIKEGRIPEATVDPVDAFLDELEEPLDQYWHRLLADYVSGHYYGSTVNVRFLDNPDRYLQIMSFIKTSVRQTAAYQFNDLSGAIYKIQLNDVDWPAESRIGLTINPSSDCGMTVFTYKPGAGINVLDEVMPGQDGQLIITNLNEIQSGAYELVVLVSNTRHIPDYTGFQPVELNVELNPLGLPDN
ncbi:MAG: hypothetical protein HN352_01890 [Bacteroidetes bacterium]|jgi:hypothetical protein|nr:hypothetical protein [Bacteroidota bacterium]MBT3749116.1 hypothetical protein [Bacteroidota bacterium]MBT4398276.1 hypothetical protein [Bacteroidota bacterium]MBT4409061.1 hypothetical protein [Bacteroidota bacterium]MBT5426835.1 hypothetical protein [Bacteroidota bacterium]